MTEGTDTTTDTQVEETPAAVETSTNENETKPEAELAEGEQPEAEDDSKKEEEPKPKRESGYDRMKRKNQYLQSEILRLQNQTKEAPSADAEKPPREEDFNGDWGKFIAASAAFEAAKAVKDSIKADKLEANKNRAAELQSEVMADFEERTEEFKSKAPDFDKVISKFVEGGGKLTDAVRELVIDSEKGPDLVYFLAKNPNVAAKINALSPLQAAKEIGKLEDSLSRPSTRTTKAPSPIKPVGGGSSAPGGEDAQIAAMLKALYG